MTSNPGSGNSASTGQPQSLVDVQDPLPESNFLWRRVFAYATSTAILALLAYIVFKTDDPNNLESLALYLALLLWFSLTYYMIAPSAEQIVRIIQAAKVLKAGVPISRRAQSENADGEKVEVETTAGAPLSTREPTPETDAAPTARSQP